jgi:glycosyltransferase involved in cell wall biosynthesis
MPRGERAVKLLVVSLFLPKEKAHHAGARFVFEILRSLSSKHEIHLATRIEEKELPDLEALRPFCREIHPYTYRSANRTGLLYRPGLLLNYMGFSRYASRLARTGDYDLVQMEWMESALMSKGISTPTVLTAHDVMSKPAERLMKRSRGIRWLSSLFKYLALMAVERRLVGKFDTIFTMSQFDRDYLTAMEPDARVKVIPYPAGLDITEKTYERQSNTMLFLASYEYRRVNVEAALHFYGSVLPSIRRSVPGATFIIAGYGPPKELKALEMTDPGVRVPGFVEDLDECYKKASVFVAPILSSGGIMVKILDAMAAGTPVVTTSYGNEGIGAVPGRDLIVADSDEGFAEAVVRLLSDEDHARNLAQRARRFVNKHYGKQAVIGKLESSYAELLGDN